VYLNRRGSTAVQRVVRRRMDARTELLLVEHKKGALGA